MRADDGDVLNILEHRDIDLSKMDILSPYAKSGEQRTIEYAKRARHLTAWEINPDHYKKLVENLPANTDTKLCDSCIQIHEETRKYDFVIIDPYFGDSKYTEGFCLFPALYRRLKSHAFILTVILLDPHAYYKARNYEVPDKRKLARKLFYETDSEIVTKQQVADAYRRHARHNGFKNTWDIWSWSFSDTIFYLQELETIK